MNRIIATGKGGVGKTTIISTLCRLLARDGYRILVFDTDPSMNLAMTLGIPFDRISTLAEDKAEIRKEMDGENTTHSHGTNVDKIIREHSAYNVDDIRVVIMGTIPSGGSGCLCSSISLVKLMVESLQQFPRGYDFVVVDSQAGPEILGRGLATSFEYNLVVTEATPKSMEVTRQVLKLGKDLNITKTMLVVNKVEGDHDLQIVRKELGEASADMVTICNDESVKRSDREATSLLDEYPGSPAVADIKRLKDSIIASMQKAG